MTPDSCSPTGKPDPETAYLEITGRPVSVMPWR
jgi:hypothetical protein